MCQDDVEELQRSVVGAMMKVSGVAGTGKYILFQASYLMMKRPPVILFSPRLDLIYPRKGYTG